MGRAMSEGGEIIVKPIVDGFVGEITGLDLASGLGTRTKSLLSRAHEGFPVLAIRDLSLNADSFMAFGAVFGDFEIDHHLLQFQDEDHRSVVYRTNRDENGEPALASAKRKAA